MNLTEMTANLTNLTYERVVITERVSPIPGDEAVSVVLIFLSLMIYYFKYKDNPEHSRVMLLGKPFDMPKFAFWSAISLALVSLLYAIIVVREFA